MVVIIGFSQNTGVKQSIRSQSAAALAALRFLWHQTTQLSVHLGLMLLEYLNFRSYKSAFFVELQLFPFATYHKAS